MNVSQMNKFIIYVGLSVWHMITYWWWPGPELRADLQVTTKKVEPIPFRASNQTPLICHLSLSRPNLLHRLVGIEILLVWNTRNRESCTASLWPDKFRGIRRVGVRILLLDAARSTFAPGGCRKRCCSRVVVRSILLSCTNEHSRLQAKECPETSLLRFQSSEQLTIECVSSRTELPNSEFASHSSRFLQLVSRIQIAVGEVSVRLNRLSIIACFNTLNINNTIL